MSQVTGGIYETLKQVTEMLEKGSKTRFFASAHVQLASNAAAFVPTVNFDVSGTSKCVARGVSGESNPSVGEYTVKVGTLEITLADVPAVMRSDGEENVARAGFQDWCETFGVKAEGFLEITADADTRLRKDGSVAHLVTRDDGKHLVTVDLRLHCCLPLWPNFAALCVQVRTRDDGSCVRNRCARIGHSGLKAARVLAGSSRDALSASQAAYVRRRLANTSTRLLPHIARGLGRIRRVWVAWCVLAESWGVVAGDSGCSPCPTGTIMHSRKVWRRRNRRSGIEEHGNELHDIARRARPQPEAATTLAVAPPVASSTDGAKSYAAAAAKALPREHAAALTKATARKRQILPENASSWMKDLSERQTVEKAGSPFGKQDWE
ncbi:hypothetical protein B0H14DRAFT_3463768 [Mycena olivaceomarginata]|nr:hypothetical protein B0H14DRAFT_3463768 [Mycena olivaceomarginata]